MSDFTQKSSSYFILPIFLELNSFSCNLKYFIIFIIPYISFSLWSSVNTRKFSFDIVVPNYPVETIILSPLYTLSETYLSVEIIPQCIIGPFSPISNLPILLHIPDASIGLS